MQLQSAVLSNELLKLVVTEMFDEEKKVKSNQKFYKCTVVSELDLHSSLKSTDTHSSVVASWNADENDAGSILLSFLLYFFISNQKDMGSNPVYSM